jgi:hypothetical protein
MLSDSIHTLDAQDVYTFLIMGIVIALGTTFILQRNSTQTNVPIINGKKPFELLNTNAKKRFFADAQGLIRAGFKKVSLTVFNLKKRAYQFLS